jgi:c-di-AMP phosphodiesterase-like protein
VAVIVIDNYDEMIQDLKEAEHVRLTSGIHEEIERYVQENHGFIIRVYRDRYFAFIEERGMRNIIANKFDLLDNVRGRFTGDRISATLSIGIGGLGRGASSLAEAESMARQALDMCLGRGGDQAAIKTQNGYEFYGGVSKGIEKRTKVKTRIIASAISEQIENCSNVIVMGHRFSDLDCLGASIGLYKSARDMKKPCVICIDREKNLVRELLEKMLATNYDEKDFLGPDEALARVNDKTLLIVVDTHVPKVLESEAVYRACKNVIVVDHHRKLVQYIDNAVIFYHEPYASSASEMVAELIQYFPSHPQITRADAELMLAGIMLDTKSFTLRTGVRTFEAAAYLRRLGADTVEVRKLFASTMDSYQKKASLVSNAEIYKNCAIAASDISFDDVKLVAPQAADELMNISGVEASFVIFISEGLVCCSARSMGGFNVQRIMEKLGGGGHHTMAAAQFSGESVESVHRMVMEAIDEYHSEVKS